MQPPKTSAKDIRKSVNVSNNHDNIPKTERKPSKKPISSSCCTPSSSSSSSSDNVSYSVFRANRDKFTRDLYAKFNTTIFEGKLPVDMSVTWAVRLNKTAGRTFFSTDKLTQQRKARIELSVKVLDSYEKLRLTLCHEMCHAAAWLINASNKPAHGRVFKYWGAQATKSDRSLIVKTCHTYEINYKFRYQCDDCSKIFGRHSDSLDTEWLRCGKCGGKLKSLGRFGKDGTPQAQKALNPFAGFVKENYSVTKKAYPETPHKDIMALLARDFKAVKLSQ